MNRNRSRRGITLIETVIAAVIMVLAMGTVVASMIFGSTSWLRGSARAEAEGSAQRAVRIIGEELRQAMAVNVDADNNGLTYRIPQKDVNGSFIAPPVWDNVTRRIYRSGTQIFMQTGPDTRAIANGVRTTDPLTNNNYTLFTPGLGTVTRSITINVATGRQGNYNKTYLSRYRETVFLRNIPDLFR